MVTDLSQSLYESLAENIGGVSGATPHKVVVATPVITLTDNSVTISCDTTGATIYYTLDGSTPTSSSTQYSSAFTLDSSCTIKAIAIKGGKSSAVAEESYVKPVTYLTQWKIVGNSEVHGTEIWSCGEYSAIDGKYHILVKPLGGSITDIALTEPLRKAGNVADSIEFPSETEGKALVTRRLNIVDWSNTIRKNTSPVYFYIVLSDIALKSNNLLSAKYPTYNYTESISEFGELGMKGHATSSIIMLVNGAMADYTATQFRTANADVEIIYELATPTTELVDAPQIEESDSYTCEISQGAKAIGWSSLTTD